MNMKKIKKMKAVMMEYVLIAILIAAAVVGAVMMFGKSISSGMDVASTAIVDPGTTSKTMENAKSDKNTSKQKATQKMKDIHGKD